MAIFGPKSVFFQLLRGCRAPKWCGFHENFFGNTFGYFSPGPKKFRPPRPHNSLFRPQKFLHTAIFRRKKPKIAIFCLFRLKIGQKRAKIKKKIFRQKFLSVVTFSKNIPKMTPTWYWHPQGTPRIAAKNVPFWGKFRKF